MVGKLRMLATQAFVIILVLILSFSESAWEGSAMPFVSSILFLMGAVLVGVASMGRLWCSLYIAGYKTEILVTEGPYSITRNPLYFFSLLGAIGVGLASETILIPIIIFIAFTIYYPFVIKIEEVELRNLFGEKHYAYCKNVPLFFPNISKLKEPEKYVVKPKIFRRHVFDALWFVWLIGIMEIIESLHELDIIPVLFKIY